MGITIEKAISHLDTYSSTMGSGQTTQAQHEQSKRVAIDIMRKYKTIEQILDDCDLEAWEVLEKVKEVVKDGNNDN